MKGLVVGLGSIGRRHARNWAMLDLGPLAICRQAKMPQPEPLGVDATEYHDLDQALDCERPDVVLVTNPTALHVSTACSGLQAGAHVLTEKPLGSSLDGVADLLEMARRTQKKLRVAYNYRFHPGLARLKALVDQHAIGRIVSGRAEVGEYLPDWHPWEDYRRSYSGRRDLGGGVVLTLSHDIDALCWVLGAPRRVTALAAHASSLEIDVEDVADMVFEFESGAIGSVHVDFLRRRPQRCIELVGENGVLRWEHEGNRVLQYLPATRQWRVEEGDPNFQRNQMYLDELREFVGDKALPRLADGEQGAAVLAIALAALRSSSEGRTVDFREEAEPVRTWLSSLNSRA
jgi:predicted dehydrogenase